MSGVPASLTRVFVCTRSFSDTLPSEPRSVLGCPPVTPGPLPESSLVRRRSEPAILVGRPRPGLRRSLVRPWSRSGTQGARSAFPRHLSHSTSAGPRRRPRTGEPRRAAWAARRRAPLTSHHLAAQRSPHQGPTASRARTRFKHFRAPRTHPPSNPSPVPFSRDLTLSEPRPHAARLHPRRPSTAFWAGLSLGPESPGFRAPRNAQAQSCWRAFLPLVLPWQRCFASVRFTRFSVEGRGADGGGKKRRGDDG